MASVLRSSAAGRSDWQRLRGTHRGAFEEPTVEVRETEEVPVVEKTARVVEEVTVRKKETERTETVRDTVRRDEVKVTDKDGRSASSRWEFARVVIDILSCRSLDTI